MLDGLDNCCSPNIEASEFTFEVRLCVIYAVEQNIKVSSSNVNHRPYFTHKSKTVILKPLKEIPKGSHGELVFRVGLQIDFMTEQFYGTEFCE